MIAERQKGFTLIELITVIVILALLAVFAIPRYLEALGAARKSTILGVEAALQAAMALVKARAKLEGDTDAGFVMMEKGEGDTTSVTTTSQLLPTADAGGIEAAIDLGDTQSEVTTTCSSDGTYNLCEFSATNSPGTCKTTYIETIASGVIAIITDPSGC